MPIFAPNLPNVPLGPSYGFPLPPQGPLAPAGALVKFGSAAATQVVLPPPSKGIWDVQLNGATVFGSLIDSFLDITYKGDTKVSDFPVEPNSFVNYNKVIKPQTVKIQVAVGGSKSGVSGITRINALLQQLDSMRQDVNLYNIITPEWTYTGYNMQDFNYKRTDAKGQNMLTADLTFVEIKQATFSSAQVLIASSKKAGDKSKTNTGTEQTTPPPPANPLTKPNIGPKEVLAAAVAAVSGGQSSSTFGALQAIAEFIAGGT